MKTNKRWTENEIKILKDNYENYPNEEILKILPNRNYKSITKKAWELNLKKTKEVKSFLIGKRNKMTGRDLTFENLAIIAKKYKTRSEFQEKDPSAYTTSRRLGLLDDVCSHMIKQKYSTPQLILNEILENVFKQKSEYNDRLTISPYEIDVNFSKLKIAFEYNGTIWHDIKGFGKNDVDKFALCKNKGSILFTIQQNGISKNYENDIKNDLVRLLPEINQITGFSITEHDIKSVVINYEKLILDLDGIKAICDKYTDFHVFIKEQNKIYHNKKT